MRDDIVTILADVGCPVYWLAWTGQGAPPAQYITFSTRERDALFADDTGQEMEATVYVEIWSETDPATIYAAVKVAMKAAGYALAESMDIFEPDDYHISMTYNCGWET